MKKRLTALCCAALLLLCACTVKEEQPPEGAYRVYFAVSGEDAASTTVDYEYHTIPPDADPVRGLITILLGGPTEAGLASPLAAGVGLRSVEREKGQLHLDLSEQYNGLPGVYLTVANACFTLTLCQVPGVESVYITVEGKPLPYQAIPVLTEDDLLLSGAEEEAVQVRARLYFPRPDTEILGSEYRKVTKTEDATLPAAAVAALIDGPEYEGLAPAVPKNTVLRSIGVEGGVCRLDLSENFLTDAPERAQDARLALYAIVNTLCALDGAKIDAVQILVEGRPLTLYGGVPALAPLEPNYDLTAVR